MRYFVLLLYLYAVSSHASTIEEIVVTADLREETTMQLASSMTVVTEDVIRSRAAQHFDDIIQTITGFELNSAIEH